MINMSYSDEEKKEEYSERKSLIADKPKYPHGLKINLDEGMAKKLGLDESTKVGDKIMMLARVEVCSVYRENYEGDVGSVSIGLQITDMDLKKPKEETDVASKMYGSSEG